MTIEYVRGDLLESGEAVIAHGCNALGAFGSGFALAIRGKIPAAYVAYERAHRSGGLKLGTVVWAEHDSGLVANCITQPTFGRRGLHLDYDALRSCMRIINEASRAGPRRFDRIAMPLIGADRGGGDWDLISGIIEQELVDVQPIVYILPGAKFQPPREHQRSLL